MVRFVIEEEKRCIKNGDLRVRVCARSVVVRGWRSHTPGDPDKQCTVTVSVEISEKGKRKPTPHALCNLDFPEFQLYEMCVCVLPAD